VIHARDRKERVKGGGRNIPVDFLDCVGQVRDREEESHEGSSVVPPLSLETQHDA